MKSAGKVKAWHAAPAGKSSALGGEGRGADAWPSSDCALTTDMDTPSSTTALHHENLAEVRPASHAPNTLPEGKRERAAERRRTLAANLLSTPSASYEPRIPLFYPAENMLFQDLRAKSPGRENQAWKPEKFLSLPGTITYTMRIIFEPQRRNSGVTLSKTAVKACAVMVLLFGMGATSKAASADAPGQICKNNGNFGFDYSTCVVCVNQGSEHQSRVCFCRSMGLSGETFANCVSGVGASAGAMSTFSILLIAAALFQFRGKIAARFKN